MELFRGRKKKLVLIFMLIAALPVGYLLARVIFQGPDLWVLVVDSTTGHGLEGVRVEVDGRTATTNSSGWAPFNLQEGDYTISFEKEGYELKEWSFHYPLEKNWVKLDLVKLA